MIKRILLVVLAMALLLVAAVAINTLRHGSRQLDVPAAPPLAVDEKGVADSRGRDRLKTVASARRETEAESSEVSRVPADADPKFTRAQA